LVGPPLSSAALDERRRRALFRSRHRGLRELDILLGSFADAHLAGLSESELAAYENLMEAPDVEALSWITAAEPLPKAYDTPLLRKLMQFHEGPKPAP
jgi:antitoxin CptB